MPSDRHAKNSIQGSNPGVRPGGHGPRGDGNSRIANYVRDQRTPVITSSTVKFSGSVWRLAHKWRDTRLLLTETASVVDCRE